MNARRLLTIWLALAAGLLLSPVAVISAEDKRAAQPTPAIELDAPVLDNAILRDMDLTIWGWSKPGTTVAVELAGQ